VRMRKKFSAHAGIERVKTKEKRTEGVEDEVAAIAVGGHKKKRMEKRVATTQKKGKKNSRADASVRRNTNTSPLRK